MATHATSPASASLQTRQLGNSDLHITPIGFGAWAIGGGDWQFAWGHQEDDESVEAIRRALELGINWIDTAAIYGLGHSEEVVARAVKSSVSKPYIFTKCSMRWDSDRKIYRSLQGEVAAGRGGELAAPPAGGRDRSLPDPLARPGARDRGMGDTRRLKEKGKLRWIGVSNFSVAQMKRVRKIAPITSLQPPYSLLNRKAEPELLSYCAQHQIGVINYSPMASGLLTGKMTAYRIRAMPQDDWRRKSPQFNEPKLSANLRLVEVLREIGRAHQVEPGVVAIAWTLRQPAVTGAIVGGRNAQQVEGTFPAATFRLSPEETARIDSFVRENLG